MAHHKASSIDCVLHEALIAQAANTISHEKGTRNEWEEESLLTNLFDFFFKGWNGESRSFCASCNPELYIFPSRRQKLKGTPTTSLSYHGATIMPFNIFSPLLHLLSEPRSCRSASKKKPFPSSVSFSSRVWKGSRLALIMQMLNHSSRRKRRLCRVAK